MCETAKLQEIVGEFKILVRMIKADMVPDEEGLERRIRLINEWEKILYG